MYTLLIVDDEDYSRNGIAALIERRFPQTFRMEKAETGEEGLELARTIRPDLIISDIRMPRMDGLTMCRRLAECAQEPCIVFMSAYSELDYYRSALKLHALSFIEKPIVPEELLGEVSRALRRLADAPPPEEAPPVESGDSPYVAKAKHCIAQRYSDPNFSVADLAESLCLSKNYISSLFKRETGVPITTWLNNVRMERAKELLRNPANRVSDVGYMVGMDNTDYFTRRFKAYTGCTPSEYRR
ncbi:MAG: response regulator [Clostridia bacterium]|nr:response regulator [Clostridia bacterium]